jgi:hypothetical protein
MCTSAHGPSGSPEPVGRPGSRLTALPSRRVRPSP